MTTKTFLQWLGEYKGIYPLDHSSAVGPHSRIVLVWTTGEAEPWIVESLDELVRFYKDRYGIEPKMTHLCSWQAPMWIVNYDLGEDSFSVGPFFEIAKAQEFLREREKEEGYLGGEIAPLTKP